MDMFNGLADIFRSRSFANLRGEPSDFLSFIVEGDLELLFSYSSSDSVFELFLKIIVRASHRFLEDLHIRKPLPGKSEKLLSLAVPVGSIFAKTSVMPTIHELSMLYNRFSAVAVAIHLDPTPAKGNHRLAQAHRYAEFDEARSNVRCVCIRAAMYFAILLHRCRLPLEQRADTQGKGRRITLMYAISPRLCQARCGVLQYSAETLVPAVLSGREFLSLASHM